MSFLVCGSLMIKAMIEKSSLGSIAHGKNRGKASAKSPLTLKGMIIGRVPTSTAM
jgi:hypothetical protein